MYSFAFMYCHAYQNWQSRKRRKLSKNVPESKYTTGTHDLEIIELSDIQYEYALLSARLDLNRKDPSLLPAGGEFLVDIFREIS